ncbi:MAG TPA: SDR family oxidoreductase [Verrucomicrobiae bacterium]|jgi:NAD(P)-dependent dehydrogenase (short-subunit alcohol dehydrogenase family)|nr:SDR family oxidoreductase [Verrucomicrobiae bacterium]
MSAFKDGLLNGKVAFVAGGTSGINLGIATRMAELGAKVAVAGRDPEKAQRAAAGIGHGAVGYSTDVRDFAATRAVMEQIVSAWGPMDIVVSGAAGNFLAPSAGLSANGFKTVIDIDLLGTFNVFRGSYDLIQKPGASLIAITAGQAVNPTMLQIHACAAKAGINQVIRVMAMEWGPEGVRVNGISPGPIAGTEGMARLAPNPEVTQALTGRIPLRRFGEISEIAESAVFLCSDSAAYITGTILDCEGGSQLGDARSPFERS